MKVKDCPNCKKKLTTKHVKLIGRQKGFAYDLLFANCKQCNTTLTIRKKINISSIEYKAYLKKVRLRKAA